MPTRIHLWPAETVLMPGTEATLTPVAPHDQAFLHHAFVHRQSVGVLWQPKNGALSRVGTMGFVTEATESHKYGYSVQVQGARRFVLLDWPKTTPACLATVDYVEDLRDATAHDPLVRRAVMSLKHFKKLIEQVDPLLVKDLPPDATLEEISFQIADQMALSYDQRQKLLEMTSLKERFAEIIGMLRIETETLRFLMDETITRDPRVCLN